MYKSLAVLALTNSAFASKIPIRKRELTEELLFNGIDRIESVYSTPNELQDNEV
jgi:hypothetical protein